MRLKDEYIRLAADDRLYGLDKPIVAVTGGISSGKSSVTKFLRERGLEIIDADELVKSIYSLPETKDFIKSNFPSVWSAAGIDFKKLREIFFSNISVKHTIENFIYQKLPDAFKEAALKMMNQQFYFYDVPLLFERGLNTQVDLNIVVYCPRSTQLSRLMQRDGNSQETGNNILDQQMSIEDKKNLADIVIENTGTLEQLAIEVDKLIVQIFK